MAGGSPCAAVRIQTVPRPSQTVRWARISLTDQLSHTPATARSVALSCASAASSRACSRSSSLFSMLIPRSILDFGFWILDWGRAAPASVVSYPPTPNPSPWILDWETRDPTQNSKLKTRLKQPAHAQGHLRAEAHGGVVEVQAADRGDPAQAVAEGVAVQVERRRRGAVVAAMFQEGLQSLQQLRRLAGAAGLQGTFEGAQRLLVKGVHFVPVRGP